MSDYTNHECETCGEPYTCLKSCADEDNGLCYDCEIKRQLSFGEIA